MGIVLTESPRSLRDLPPFPPVALQVLRQLSSQDVETSEIVGTLANDPVFSGEVLRMANSSLFGLARQVRTLRLAVVVLGRDRLRGVTMAVALRSYVTAPKKFPHFADWWQHSLATALLTDGLAAAWATARDFAYTAGLVHSIGRLGLMTLYPKAYLRLAEAEEATPGEILELERSIFGVDHCEAGRLMMEKWGLPRELIGPAEHHHDEPLEDEESLVSQVRLGCRLASGLGFACLPHPCELTIEDVLNQLPPAVRREWTMDPEKLREAVRSRIDPLLGT